MYEGLAAAIVELDEPLPKVTSESFPDQITNHLPKMAIDFALAAATSSTPCTLDKTLCGPNAEWWQAVLEYEISQLEKLGTWVVEDLLKGQTAIPCSEVLKEKQGPSGGIETF